jgi:predicted MPP superfamily phosphohydrolase
MQQLARTEANSGSIAAGPGAPAREQDAHSADVFRQQPEAHSAMHLDAADYTAIAGRLGSARLRQRLAAQVHHVANGMMRRWLLLGVHPTTAVNAFVAWSARLSGLYALGYRNFKSLRIVENPIRHPRMPAALRGLRVLQLSDLHLDLDPRLGGAIRELVAGLDYDIVVLTGDFRDTTWSDHGPSVEQTVAILDAFDKPVYAILGNHDFIEIVPPLERAGVRFLLNEVDEIPFNGATLHLAGIDDPNFYRTHDLAGVRDAIPDSGFSVLLSHSPETFREAADHGFDVMLSGHTHGGQICLPGGYALVKVCDVPRRLLSGAWQQREMLGYTSVGTGSCGVPLRYFCPPEITLHRFEQAI